MRHPFLGIALVMVWAAAMPAAAHPVSIVVESAFVERDSVYVDVEIFAEDLYFYHGLETNEASEVEAENLRAASLKHGPLLIERLPIYDTRGNPLPGGKVATIEGNEFPEDIPVGELMGHNLRYRLEWSLDSPPEFLSFSQILVDSDAGFPALVDLRVKQAGKEEETEITLKPGNVRTVQLVWDDPQPGDADEREEWMEARREDALGANALNSVRSFLYISHREVRHEILMPFPLLESYLTIDRQRPNHITPGEQNAARPAILDAFRDKNPISIDGQRQSPASMRVEFFNLEELDRTQAPPPKTLNTINSRVGIMLIYPTPQPAKSVDLLWDAFNRQAWQVDAYSFAGDDVSHTVFSKATRKQRFSWDRPAMIEPVATRVAAAPPERFLLIPWLVLLLGGVGLVVGWFRRRRPAVAGAIIAACFSLAGAIWPGPALFVPNPFVAPPRMSSEEAQEIVRTLHENLYLACGAATDEDALRAISAATDGELRRDMYLQLIRALRDPDDLGLRPAAGEVVVTSGKLLSQEGAGGAFQYLCEWEATGRAEHWGHVHTRRYGYEALLSVAPRDGNWLITDLHLNRVRVLADRAIGIF